MIPKLSFPPKLKAVQLFKAAKQYAANNRMPFLFYSDQQIAMYHYLKSINAI